MTQKTKPGKGKIHWHYNQKWKKDHKLPDYLPCSKENCKERIIKPHRIPRHLGRCYKCGTPLKRIGPYSWKGNCPCFPKDIIIGCL